MLDSQSQSTGAEDSTEATKSMPLTPKQKDQRERKARKAWDYYCNANGVVGWDIRAVKVEHEGDRVILKPCLSKGTEDEVVAIFQVNDSGRIRRIFPAMTKENSQQAKPVKAPSASPHEPSVERDGGESSVSEPAVREVAQPHKPSTPVAYGFPAWPKSYLRETSAMSERMRGSVESCMGMFADCLKAGVVIVAVIDGDNFNIRAIVDTQLEGDAFTDNLFRDVCTDVEAQDFFSRVLKSDALQGEPRLFFAERGNASVPWEIGIVAIDH